LAVGVYLSEAPYPPVTHCMKHTPILLTQGRGGGGERERR